MTDYDNTNRGAAFPPFPEQQLILQGKLDIHGNENNVACILQQSKSGEKRIEVYRKIGVLFENDKQGNDKAPDYSGPLEGIFDGLRIAGWKGMKDNKPYMTMQVSEKQQAQAQPQPTAPANNDLGGDDIPF